MTGKGSELGFEDKWYQEYINIHLRKEVRSIGEEGLARCCCFSFRSAHARGLSACAACAGPRAVQSTRTAVLLCRAAFSRSCWRGLPDLPPPRSHRSLPPRWHSPAAPRSRRLQKILQVLEEDPRTALQYAAVGLFLFFMLYKLGRIIKDMRELGMTVRYGDGDGDGDDDGDGAAQGVEADADADADAGADDDDHAKNE